MVALHLLLKSSIPKSLKKIQAEKRLSTLEIYENDIVIETKQD